MNSFLNNITIIAHSFAFVTDFEKKNTKRSLLGVLLEVMPRGSVTRGSDDHVVSFSFCRKVNVGV